MQQWWSQHFDFEGAPAALHDPLKVRQRLAALVQHIPLAWQEAAWEHYGSNRQPSEAEATAALLGCLGWQRQQGQPLALEKFKVRHGTQLQLGEIQQKRMQKFAAFETLAAGGGGSQQSQPDGSITAQLLSRLWRLPWDNQHKEVFWRLALNGLPLAARMPASGQPCSCGTSSPLPDRLHHRECPVAVAVVSSLEAQLGGQLLAPPNIWLAQPQAGVHMGLWELISLASISAMDAGRRLLYRQAATPCSDTATSSRVDAACRHATARLSVLLQDFCSLKCAPIAWQAEVHSSHPLIHWQQDTQSWQLTHPEFSA